MSKTALRRVLDQLRRMPANTTPAEALAVFRRLLVAVEAAKGDKLH